MLAILRALARPLVTVFVIASALPAMTGTAAAQPSQGSASFSIDLDQVSRLYDSLYRDRITGALIDSTVAYDYKTIRFGQLRHRVPTFLPTDADTVRTVTDYRIVPGYRVTFVVPRTAFFEPIERPAGEFIVTEPRNFDSAQIEMTESSEVADEIYLSSRQQVWYDATRARITAYSPTTGLGEAGGIRFDIPLPMPKSLESIFGPGEKTSITLRGREEITIAGQTTVQDPFIGAEGREEQSLFPSLDMEQKLDVSLTGTIGDKVSIQVDHSSEAIGDDANRVRLAYTGYEDEVIQLIELGNTSLSLPGSQLVSVSTNAQGLFGIKMLAKMGATDITMIASKQEGEVSSAQFSPTGGSLGQTETRTIRDVDYVRNKYFYFNDPRVFPLAYPRPAGIDVYRTVTQQDLAIDPSIQRREGWAIPDQFGDGADIDAVVDILLGGGTPDPTLAIKQDFELLERSIDYEFIIDAETDSIVGIEVFEPIADAALKTLAVSYVQADGSLNGGTFAAYGFPVEPNGAGDLLVLEMLKAPDPGPDRFRPTWFMMFRNIYNLGLTNIDGTSLEVQIVDVFNPRLNTEAPDSSDVPYLRIFGLDQTDRAGTGGPDGAIDLTFGRVNLNTGLLQFPSITAFYPPPALVSLWTAGEFSFTPDYQTQYDTSARIYNERLNANDEADVHQYAIQVTAVSTSKTFRINALNVVENSENITLDGQKLTRGTDYDIDYLSGEVTLKETVLTRLTPDSRINIDYEYKPLGGLGSSTLAGMSTASRLGENLRIGTTLLYESKSVSGDKARLGEEPTRAVVGGVTGNYQHQSRLLTDIANWLPYVDTDAPSTVNIDAEIAASLPNPNTKHEAYIDDFEGVEDTDRIPISRRSWYPASIPYDAQGAIKPDTSRVDFLWYNIEADRGIHRRDLNPELDERENTLVQTLDIDLDASPVPGDTVSFAGLMLGFQGGGNDFSQGQFIELWINDFKPDPLTRGGKLRIDMGIIDENFYEPELDEFNDEDINRDGFAAAFDDNGLDGVPNEEETLTPPNGTSEDPAGDDIDLRRIDGRYKKVNGTEGNVTYDTEDLDRNGQLSRENAYFSYEIDLANVAEIDIRQQYPGYDGFDDPDHRNDSWRLYRVKLSDYRIVAPSGIPPRFDEIRHLRIWFDDTESIVRDDGEVGARRLQIAEFQIEGNRWELDGVRDLADTELIATSADFVMGVISTKTDPGVYQPPVRPNTENEVEDKESSLALRYTGLGDSTQIRILKRFSGQGLDLTLYRDLNFWVHTDQLRDGVEYYFRMGANETSFYEVIVPMTSEYFEGTGWARVVIDLADLTNLKLQPPDSVVTGTAPDIAEPGKSYPVRMRGTPSIAGVRFLYAGVRNVSNPVEQSGEIWINDIFTGDVMRDFDHAERVSANMSVAGGAISLGGNWSRSGADYRGLRQTRGDGANRTTLGLNAKTDLQHFLPLGGFSIPLAAAFNRGVSEPKFVPNSDIEILDAAVSDSLRTERIGRSFSTSLSKRTSSNNFLMRYTFDRLRPTFSYSDARGVSPSQRDTTTSMNGGLSYQLTWSGDKSIPLFGKNRLRWLPNSLDFSSTATRQTAIRWSLRAGEFRRDPFQYSASLRNQGSIRYVPFRSIEGSFGMTVNRDVAREHEWMGVNVGEEVGRSNNLRISFVVPKWHLVKLLEPSLEVQSSYNEDASANVRRPGDPAGTRNVNAGRNDTAKLRFELGRHIGTVFKWVGWDIATGPEGRTPQHGGRNVTNPADTTAADADTTASPRPGLGSTVRGLGRILTSIRPLNANIQHRETSSYLRISDRPDMAYRLGFTTATGIEGVVQPDQKREDWSYNVDTGVQLLNREVQRMDLQGRYSRSTNDNDFRSNETRTTNVTWPDLQLSWEGLQSFKPLQPVIATGQFNVSYRETRAESGPRNQEPNSTSETFTLTPSLLLTWKNQLNSTLNMSLTENSRNTRGSRSTDDRVTLSLNLRKNFRAGGGIGFFGKDITWSNELESTFDISYSRSGGERFTQGSSVPEPIPATTSFRMAPTVRYYFSTNVSGSAFIDFTRAFSEATDVTTTSLRLGVTAVINF